MDKVVTQGAKWKIILFLVTKCRYHARKVILRYWVDCCGAESLVMEQIAIHLGLAVTSSTRK